MTAAAILASSLPAGAQHITFKSVPVDGTRKEFTLLLREKGFKETDNRAAGILSGVFAGRQATVVADTTATSGTVFRASAFLEQRSKWAELKDDYLTFKRFITEKYGTPIRSEERFDSPYHEGDGFEMKAVSLGKCRYGAAWNHEAGRIEIGISPAGREPGKACLRISYIDMANTILAEREMEEIYKEDL